MKDQIEYNGKSYPVVELPKCGYRVSTESLEEALLDDGCCPRDAAAERIDEGIYYYVPDEIIGRTPEEIESFVEANID